MIKIVGTAIMRFVYNPRETFNPSYNPIETWTTSYNHGSRQYFATDFKINGEYFKSKSKNEYYKIIPSNIKINDLIESELKYQSSFIPPLELYNRMKNDGFDPETQCIVKLIIEDDKGYFVENYQHILAPPYAHIEIMPDIKDEKTFISKVNMDFKPIPDIDVDYRK